MSESDGLCGNEGELVSLSISVESRLLEQLLETLARLQFPINPQIYHTPSSETVEFPAWGTRIAEVRDALVRGGLEQARVTARSMWDRIHNAPNAAIA